VVSAAPSTDTYIFDYLSRYPELLDRPGVREPLFARLEGDLVAAMAAHHESFAPALRFLESAVLPAAVKVGDWRRFLRFAVVAVNIRGLAADLTPPVLAAVASAGHGRLAATLADERVDPLERLRARAAVADALRRRGEEDGAVAAGLLGSLAADFEALPGPEARAAALEELAPRLADALRGRWDGWIDELAAASPAAADRVRLALADAELAAGETGDATWARIAAVSDRVALGDLLARRAADLGDDLSSMLTRLRRLAVGDAALYAPAAVAVAAERAAAVPARAAPDLAEVRRSGPFAWSVETVARGGALWAALAPAGRETLYRELAAEPRLVVALAVVALEAARRPELADEAEWAASTSAPGRGRQPLAPDQLHWESRRLAADPRRDGPWRVAVARLEGGAAVLRFALPPWDLARLLDLVAEAEPRRLGRRLDEALWAPASDAATLRGIASAARHPRLLDELSRRTEQLAATVAESEAAAFELRRELIHRMTIEACRCGESLESLDAMAERLLPEEEDELRSELAPALAADGRGLMAAAAAAGIVSPRLRRRAELAALAVRADVRTLDPADLYHAVAAVEPVDDELAALAALDDPDPDPRQVAKRYLEPIADRGRRVLALAELAGARLDAELRRPAHAADPDLALLPLVDGLGAAVSDTWLAALAPELAELGGRIGPRRALVELGDAAERVVDLAGAPWSERERAVLAIIRSAPPLLAPRPGADGARRHAELLRMLLDLPARIGDGPGGEDLRRHGHRLLPYLVAAVEAAPEPVRRRLAASSFAGLWRLLRRLDDRGPVALDRWRRAGAEAAVVADLCAAPTERRRWREVEVLRGAGSPAETEALAALAAAGRPEAALRLLAAMPPDEERAARLRLATSGLLPPAAAAVSTSLLGEDAATLRARLRAGERLADDDLVALVAGGGLDADDPALLALRRRLRDTADPALAERLARAVAPALARGGAPGGESALRLWLHAAWRPYLSGGDGDSAALDGWRRGVRGAARIAGEAERASTPSETGTGLVRQLAPLASSPGKSRPLARVLVRSERAWKYRRGLYDELTKSGIVSVVVAFATIPLLPGLGPDKEGWLLFPPLPLYVAWPLIMLVACGNMLLIPPMVAHAHAAELAHRSSRLVLRCLAAVPLLGLLVIPAYHLLHRYSPSGMFRDQRPLTPRWGPFLRRGVPWVASGIGATSVLAVNWTLVLLLEPVIVLPALAMWGIRVLLSLATFSAMMSFGFFLRFPRRAAWLAAASWLLPFYWAPAFGMLVAPALFGKKGSLVTGPGENRKKYGRTRLRNMLRWLNGSSGCDILSGSVFADDIPYCPRLGRPSWNV
jgi:hypothetical protein